MHDVIVLFATDIEDMTGFQGFIILENTINAGFSLFGSICGNFHAFQNFLEKIDFVAMGLRTASQGILRLRSLFESSFNLEKVRTEVGRENGWSK